MSYTAFARSHAPQRGRRMRSLARALVPREMAIELPAAARLIEAAHTELAARAICDADRCYGYFPALAGTPGIDDALPASRRLAAEMPEIAVDSLALGFNFLRLSLRPQHGQFPFHLDSDAATALTGEFTSPAHVPAAAMQYPVHPRVSGDPGEQANAQSALDSRLRGNERSEWDSRLRENERSVWRLLVNLSTARPRTLAYLDLDAACVRLAARGGYIQCAQPVDVDRIVRLTLPPRQGRCAHGVLFCASRVLHSGEDGEEGHFVAGFGRE